MHYVENLLTNGTFSVFAAFFLGIITSIHPCPLTLNIAALGHIIKDMSAKSVVFTKGLAYTAGRIVTYTILALVLYYGSEALNLTHFISHYGEIILAPFLIIVGLLMLDIIPYKFPVTSKITSLLNNKVKNKHYSSFFMGSIYALFFCPHTILFFGMLIPFMASPAGLILPVCFGIGTGLPVIVAAWILTYSISKINSFYSNLKNIEKWIRLITAIICIFAGVLYILQFAFGGHSHTH